MSSPPTEAMGRFGLTVQAAVLLGKVLKYSRLLTSGYGFQEDEARILDNTVAALTKVSLLEGQHRGMGVCSPTTICHSARLILNHQMVSWIIDQPNLSTELDRLLDVQVTIALDMLGLAQHMIETGLCGSDDISPFCHDALYRSAIIYARLSQKSNSKHAQNGLHDIEQSLKVNSSRWKTAATYLQLIEARNLTGIL